MTLSFLDGIGNWNPQLFREIKGRLKFRNLAIAGAISILGQLFVLMSFIRQIPSSSYPILERYCLVRDTYLPYQKQYQLFNDELYKLRATGAKFGELPKTISDKAERIRELETKTTELRKIIYAHCPTDAINVQLWWQDNWPHIFVWLSLFAFFILLVVGTYMLVSDLAAEERRGTLNFIRLSPQSSRSVLVGKMLGVPILLYFAAILAVPFHLWAGISAQISLLNIFSFYAVIIASCAFFYSAALLFSLISSWLVGFQSWLAGGAVLGFLTIANTQYLTRNPGDWLPLFSPSVVLSSFVDGRNPYQSFPLNHWYLNGLQWFYLPLGANSIGIVIFVLLNYGFWTYWIGQALSRRFRSEQATLLSKRQSYLLVACFEVLNLGFALQTTTELNYSRVFDNFAPLLVLNGLLFLALTAALSPHRQVLQDWARYKQEGRRNNVSSWSHLVQDLIWGEKSPATAAIAINILITSVPLIAGILVWPGTYEQRMESLATLILFQTFLLICAALVQLMLLMKTRKRALWAAGTLGTAIFLPPFVLGVLSIDPGENGGGLWLLTAFLWNAVRYASATLICQVLLIQWTLFSILTWQLTRQLQRAGESASKALLKEG